MVLKRSKQKVILLGLCIALVLSLGLLQQVNAREGDMENLEKMLEEYNQQLGLEDACSISGSRGDKLTYKNGTWYTAKWMEGGRTGEVNVMIRVSANETLLKILLPFFVGKGTPMTFHGGPALIKTESETGQVKLPSAGDGPKYSYIGPREIEKTGMGWYVGRFSCSILLRRYVLGTGIIGTTEAIVTDQFAELMYELAVKYGFIESTTIITGFVTDGHADSGKKHPLANVSVAINVYDKSGNWMGDLATVYTNTNATGHFKAKISDPEFVIGTGKKYSVWVELSDRDNNIRIIDKSSKYQDAPVTAETHSFRLNTTEDMVDTINLSTNLVTLKDIDFSNTSLFMVPADQPDLDHLDDNAAIYYHTYQAVDFARKVLKLNLDLDLPLDICTYANDDTSWEGPMTGHTATARIIINKADSDYTSPDRPRNREWHEFGHHVMADAFDVMPCRGEKRHGGYENDHTTDSWCEGWAEFYSCLVKKHTSELQWRVYGNFGSLEKNYKCWDDEEFAIAGILIDLRDGPSDIVSILYDNDAIALTTGDIWDVIKNGGTTAGVGSKGHIFDLKDLYDAFNSSATRLGYTSEQLNDIFIAHGAFWDANDNYQYDPGETKVGNAANKTRPDRRNRPLKEGSYVLFSAEDSSTGAQIDADEFTVKVVHDPPYDIYDYQFSTRPVSANKLYFELVPTDYPCKAYITAHNEGFYDSEELVIESSFYFENYDPAHDSFLEHDFRLAPAQVPDFVISAAPSSETIFQGEEAKFDIKLRALKGFESPVSLSLSGLPAGASYEFSSESFTPPGTSRLTIKTPSTVPTGSFVLSVEGKSDTLVHSCKITLTIKEGREEPAPTGKKTIYVDDDFTDDPANHKWNTIQEGITDANDGDTVLVYTGTYNETVVLNMTLTLVGEGLPTIDASGTGNAITITADNCIVKGFTCVNAHPSPYAGIRVESNNNVIEDNTCKNNGFGIILLTSTENIIAHNTAKNNDKNGIYLQDSNSNRITDNTASNSVNYHGISLKSSNNNEIRDNSANSNHYQGIRLGTSNENIIANNAVENNGDYGIALWTSDANMVANNMAKNNGEIGIILSASQNNEIANNTANSNNIYGIRLHSHSDNNILTNNIANSNNKVGIICWTSSGNILTYNKLNSNKCGIGLYNYSTDNILANNTATANSYGISVVRSSNNNIYLNNFVDNTDNAYSYNSNNIWRSASKLTHTYNGKSYWHYLGNYWSDYRGSDTDGDGIGDSSYSIDGDEDEHPLMKPWENYFAP